MMRTAICISIILLQSCNQRCTPPVIDKGSYTGNALAFYHMPVTGSNCEIIFVPICGGNIKPISEIIESNYSNISETEGVSVDIDLRDSSFNKLFSSAEKLKLINHDSLASVFRFIHVCSVGISFSEVNNNSSSLIRRDKNLLEENLVFANGLTCRLKYFFSNEIKIDYLKIF